MFYSWYNKYEYDMLYFKYILMVILTFLCSKKKDYNYKVYFGSGYYWISFRDETYRILCDYESSGGVLLGKFSSETRFFEAVKNQDEKIWFMVEKVDVVECILSIRECRKKVELYERCSYINALRSKSETGLYNIIEPMIEAQLRR